MIHGPSNVKRVHSCWGKCHPKQACLEAKSNIPTAGPTLLWARNSCRENYSYWKVSHAETGRMIRQRRLGNEKGTTF